MQEDLRGQYIARRVDARRRTGSPLDQATVVTEASRWFEAQWRNIATRLEIVPGKATLAALNTRLQVAVGVSLTEARIVDAIHANEIASDFAALLANINGFRQSTPATSDFQTDSVTA